jgi:hypothetical protein
MILEFLVGSDRSQWTRGLRCGTEAAGLLGMQVRMPPESWNVCVLCVRPADPYIVTSNVDKYTFSHVYVITVTYYGKHVFSCKL